nr:MAG TPA: tail collar fiber protein [Caudoviricetes sp.]
MASQYFAILTDYGTRAIAHALSQGQPLQLAKFAVGDGNGQAVTPTASATALVHQTHSAPVSAVSLDPRNNKQVIVELTIPENVGGFYIREMGVFDAQNKLIAYANCPESFKPTESSGSGKVQVLRMILKVESSSAVTLSIDNSVIFVTRQQMTPKTITATTQNGFDDSGHSHEINKASTSQQGIVQLTNDTGLESESLALTAKAGKKLAQLIATVQLALNNYIPLNKRSSAVNSNDENNVATSKAVKTAYDKGVEAKTAADNAQRSANDGINRANNAQSSANEANNNANGRVSKSGDTMTGNLTVPNIIVNDPTNNNNSVQIGDDTKLIDVDMGHTVGLQATDNANDAYIAYGATKKRFGFDGVNFTAESGLGAQWFGTPKRGDGAYANQWRTEAPYHVQAGNANGSNTYFPYLKGKVTNGDGWGAAFSFGYVTPGARNQFGTGIIHLIEDNGADRKWEFAHNGNFSSAADVVTGSGKSLNNTHQQSYDYVQVTGSVSYGGLSILKPDGKSMRFEREGNAFKFWCQDMYSILMPEKSGTVILDADISHATNGNDKAKVASEFALGELYKQTVTDIRLGALATRKLGSGSWTSHGNGYVVVGFENGNWDALHASDNIHLRPIQKKLNGQWVTISNV